ncbi:MAG: DMT family transporter [Proteobacteria bacterium]|nr:DMT family transporter [Pseudomonadota bacterium]
MSTATHDLQTPNYRARALPALILGGIAIGFSPVLVRMSELGPVSTAFWRIALALLPLIVLSRRADAQGVGTGKAQTWSERGLAALPGLFLGAELSTWHLSLHMTSVANATLLINMTPIPVALLGWLIFRTPISRTFVIGLVLSIVGVIVLKGGPGAIGSKSLAGDGVALLGSVLYAGYFLSLGRVRNRFSTLTVMRWSTLAAGLAVLPFALALEPHFVPVTLAGWAVVLALAWVCHFGGQSFITFALAWLPPSFSSLTLLIQPVVAALLAWWLLKEPLSALQALGGVIVLAGILVARKG